VGLSRAQHYGLHFPEYKQWLENHSVLIVQVEHILAVQNLEEILNVPGIDGIIVGPYDLSASMGMPGKFDDPAVIEALAQVEKIGLERGINLGFHVIPPVAHQLAEKRDKGYNFLAFSLDFLFLGQNVREQMNAYRNRS
jgi:2-dehydro-3-deoxyglucarate aldolase